MESERYEDKVKEKKKKFINKMELFKRHISELEKQENEELIHKRFRNKMRVKMLGEEVKRSMEK